MALCMTSNPTLGPHDLEFWKGTFPKVQEGCGDPKRHKCLTLLRLKGVEERRL